jgi:predicted Na+-dependent transporter
MLGILTVPLLLKMLLGRRPDLNVTINLADLLLKLGVTIVAPSLLGKVRASMHTGAQPTGGWDPPAVMCAASSCPSIG